MTYLFNTPDQQQEMLKTIGVGSIESLFERQIPDLLRLKRPLDLPPAESELALETRMRSLAEKNVGVSRRACFLGGGAYDHFIPAAIDEVASRGEYYTAYTPYQAEASQGTLQTFFEYQTLICQLTGMDVANASLYEGGTAVTEAIFMAQRVTDRRRVLVLGSVHPEYRNVAETYLEHLPGEMEVIPTQGGVADVAAVTSRLNDSTACLVVQQPNYFGCLEEIQKLIEAAHHVGALAIVACDPISLGLLQRPGDYGADIVVCEGQPLGIPLQYGGPYLGVLACRTEFVRKMPGRLIGETVDAGGNRCFVLNLQAREQHIRRDKATSNICTNQGLLALRATLYLSLVGPEGLREVSSLCLQKAHYAADVLQSVPGVRLAFAQPFFKEFAIIVDGGAEQAMAKARNAGIDIGPLIASVDFPREMSAVCENAVLVAVTEKRSKSEIDRLAKALAQ